MTAPPPRPHPSRRAVIGGFAAGAAVAWTVPAIVSVNAAAAATPPPFAPVLLAGNLLEWMTQDAAGNLRVSADGGITWATPLAGSMFPGTALAVTTGFAVLTDGNASFVVSTDLGENWSSAAAPPGNPVAGILPQEPFVVLASDGVTNGQIYMTGDLGMTWDPVPFSPLLMLLAGSGGNYVGRNSSDLWFFSNSGGATWQSNTTPPVIIPVLAAGGPTAFVAIGPLLGDTRYTIDGGAVWLVPGTAPTFVPTLLAGGGGGFVVTDGQGQWAQSSNGNVWAPVLGPAFNAILLAGYGGTFVTTDGTDWARSEDGIIWEAILAPPA